MQIPPEVKRDIDPSSGWLRLDSPFHGRPLVGLFRMPQNIAYLGRILGTPESETWDLVISFALPHWEDFNTENPVRRLHIVNTTFLKQAAKAIADAPVIKETAQWEYGDASWADGTWHPEQLFTNSERNRKSGYWSEWSLTPGTYFDASPEATGPGHRFNREVYGCHQFPRWQDLRRQIDRDIDEDLREGGNSDRRTVRPSGYNMATLQTQPSWRKTESRLCENLDWDESWLG